LRSSRLLYFMILLMFVVILMQGFINRRIPLFLRRLITMLPALTSWL
jgi:hypothetical protein